MDIAIGFGAEACKSGHFMGGHVAFAFGARLCHAGPGEKGLASLTSTLVSMPDRRARARQVENMLALLFRFGGDIGQTIGAVEADIGLRQRAGDGEPRAFGVELRGLRFIARS